MYDHSIPFGTTQRGRMPSCMSQSMKLIPEKSERNFLRLAISSFNFIRHTIAFELVTPNSLGSRMG
jgi:hypothetical protein